MQTATADGRAGRRLRAWTVVLPIAAIAAGVFALRADPAPARDPRPAVHLVSDQRHRYPDVAALTASADLVVDGRVVAAERGRVFGTGDRAITSHVLTVQVDDVLADRAHALGDRNVVLVEEEATLADGTPVVVDGMRAARVGDRGTWFLVASTDPEFPGYAVVGAQGRYLRAADGSIRGGDPTDALVRRVEHAGAQALAAQVRRAAP